jgi:hypothetical protein
MDSMECFNYVCSLKTNYASCGREIKSSISMAEDSFSQSTGLKFTEETTAYLCMVLNLIHFGK